MKLEVRLKLEGGTKLELEHCWKMELSQKLELSRKLLELSWKQLELVGTKLKVGTDLEVEVK